MSNIPNIYHNNIRIRICGICLVRQSILLVNHQGLTPSNEYWMPPGGGIAFGETIHSCLKRELYEETGYHVTPGKFVTIHEHIVPPLHAIEHFYEAAISSGTLKKGIDPELQDQIIKDVKWVPLKELANIPQHQKHPILEQFAR